MKAIPSSCRARPRLLKSGIACMTLCLTLVSTAAWADRFSDLEQYLGIQFTPGDIKGPQCLGMTFLSFSVPECPAGKHAEWISLLRQYRSMRYNYIAYDGSRYELPALKWAQASFVEPQMMAGDRYFYDPVAGKYTVDRYLDDLNTRYGGIDSVLIWPVYPNMGIDDRNQLDFIRDMPGGITGVRQMVGQFHQRGVRVLFPMNMWDQGTRSPGASWPQAIAKLMKAVNADGVNGDTQDGVPLGFFDAAETLGHPLAFEPEDHAPDEDLQWDVMSWWYPSTSLHPTIEDEFVPVVNESKWMEPRFMALISDRWAHSHIGDIQTAFFNGVGVVSWENVWGIWNGITPRDGEALRRFGTLSRALVGYLHSPDWEPFYPTLQFGVFASRWPEGDKTLWTVINRSAYEVDGKQLSIPFKAGEHYFDLYAGAELKGERQGSDVVLSFPIEKYGFRAILATPGDLGPEMRELIKRMKLMSAKPLSAYSDDWHPLPQLMVPIAPSKLHSTAPAGMVAIPAGHFDFLVHGIEVEGGNEPGVDVQYPWENIARRFHEHEMTIPRFFIDRYPVTNADFKNFIDATHYSPRDDHNFLKDWSGSTVPRGWGRRPVTWVSLGDARAYCAWVGKRLPHEWEWQYAAQGTAGRLYPWGSQWRSDAVPTPDKSRKLTGPDPVDAHPGGASPFGVMDMVGNVWQWTDEFRDEHTRAAILRGGSYYQPQGALSFFYFPQAYQNDEHGKYLLMAPSIDRAGTVGFRCAADATQ